MHPSARAHMKLCIELYLNKDRHYRVLDFGSRTSVPWHPTHRDLFEGYDIEYVGVDVRPGRNVDVVMPKPYRIPLKSNSVDLVVSGQVFEHIPFPFASLMEIARVVRPGGLVFITAPSRGHTHDITDCWRYYPDSMRSLAAFTRLNLREVHTDMPPKRNGRLNYSAVPWDRYWGDTVGVFQKPMHASKLVRVAGAVTVWWANRVGGISHVEVPKPRPRRVALARSKLAAPTGAPSAEPEPEE